MTKIIALLDENAHKKYKVKALDTLYFVKQSSDWKCFQKSRFIGTQAENDENYVDIAPLEDVTRKEIAPKIHFNDYVTSDKEVQQK